jgi:hypothetical protein
LARDDGTQPRFLPPFENWQGGRFVLVRRSGKADGSGIPGTSHSVILAFHSSTPLFRDRPDAAQTRALTGALARFARCRWTEAGIVSAGALLPRMPTPSVLQIMVQHGEAGVPTQIFEIHFALANGKVGNRLVRGGIMLGNGQARFVA